MDPVGLCYAESLRGIKQSMVQEQLIQIKIDLTNSLAEVKRLIKLMDTPCYFLILYRMFCKTYFYKKAKVVRFWCCYGFILFMYKFLLVI